MIVLMLVGGSKLPDLAISLDNPAFVAYGRWQLAPHRGSSFPV
jgi:hypothetical protein